MGRRTPGSPVHYLPEFAQIQVHWVGDAIQPSHPLPTPSPFAFNLSQHQGLFQWVSSSHQAARVLSFSFSISPSNKYSGLISFRMDWLDVILPPMNSPLPSLLQECIFKRSLPSSIPRLMQVTTQRSLYQTNLSEWQPPHHSVHSSCFILLNSPHYRKYDRYSLFFFATHVPLLECRLCKVETLSHHVPCWILWAYNIWLINIYWINVWGSICRYWSMDIKPRISFCQTWEGLD